MAVENMSCDQEDPHDAHLWYPSKGSSYRVYCEGSPEPLSDAAPPWFVCIWYGHKWRWKVRLIWAEGEPQKVYGVTPIHERCTTCKTVRPLNMYRWIEWFQSRRYQL